MDGAEDGDESEHLWFRVHDIADHQVEATLLNEPYQVARMHEGDRGWHDLELLTDWQISCPHGEFNPDKIILLKTAMRVGL